MYKRLIKWKMENKEVNGTKTSDIRFSVVIPTRERAETLKYALKTCLNQQRFDNYEVVVCDNCSSPATKQVVDSFESEKIKYIRSDTSLAMTDNWELAVSHAVGEYIIFIGDDDGLFSYSLYEIDRLLKELNVEALRCNTVHYGWPGTYTKGKKQYLMIPLDSRIRLLRAVEVIPKAANFQMPYSVLPMAYYSAIHKNLFNLLRKKTGRVFRSTSPDVYSGFAFAYLAQVYAFAEFPLMLTGTSIKSMGGSWLKSGSPVVQDFRTLNEKSGFVLHPQIPNILTANAAIGDSFQRAKDALFPEDSRFCIDRKQLIINCMKLKSNSKEEWISDMQAIRESLSDDVNLQKWFDSEFSNTPPPPFVESKRNFKNFFYDFLNKEFVYDFLRFLHHNSNNYFYLELTKFGVTDVFGAAQLYEKEVYYKNNRFKRFKRKLLYARLKFFYNLSLPVRVFLKKYLNFPKHQL